MVKEFQTLYNFHFFMMELCFQTMRKLVFNVIIIQMEVLSIFVLASLIKESNVEVIVVEEEEK